MSDEGASGDSSLEKTLINEESSSEDDTLIALESLEKLDLCPPDLPEKLPRGRNDITAKNTTQISDPPPAWTSGLSQEDINFIQHLGKLSANGFNTEINKLLEQGYQLGVMEAKEILRGKYLNIFPKSQPKGKKQDSL